MARILAATLPASGHINPMLALAQALCDEGHTVAISTDGSYEAQLQRAGFQLYPMAYPKGAVEETLKALRHPNRWLDQFSANPPQSYFFRHLDLLVDSIITAIQEFKPDVVLTDLNTYAAPIAAEACNVPCAGFFAIVNPIHSQSAPPFGLGLAWAPPWNWRRFTWPFFRAVVATIEWRYDRLVNRVRKAHGLENTKGALLAHAPYLTLIPVTEAYEYPRHDLPSEVMYIGSVTTPQRGETHDDFPWEWLERDNRPTLFVSMGTIVTGDAVFRHVIELAKNADWKAIIAVGRNLTPDAYAPYPENVLIRQYVPQLEILGRVDAVVSHGGNNTVTETLMHGLPLVVIPINADQPDSAAHVVACGAGIRLSPWRLSVKKLGRAIESILTDSCYREAAQRIQASYAEMDGPQTAAKLIGLLATYGRPIQRPADMPPTITLADVEILATKLRATSPSTDALTSPAPVNIEIRR